MQNITIGRFDKDPTAQGAITPADKRWQLVIDKDGYPHLYVQVQVELAEGDMSDGMFLVEDLFPKDFSIRSLMDGGAFLAGAIDEAAERAAFDEYMARKETDAIPCPRLD